MSFRVNSKNFYNSVAYYRKLKGYSQTDLGKFVGLSKASISKIETCKSGTTAYVAARICFVLGVSFEDCFYFI